MFKAGNRIETFSENPTKKVGMRPTSRAAAISATDSALKGQPSQDATRVFWHTSLNRHVYLIDDLTRKTRGAANFQSSVEVSKIAFHTTFDGLNAPSC